MASSSPPPPPDPNRLNPFRSGCGASSTPLRAPALRRSKTLANPESPTRWRREPLTDVTNAVVGRDQGAGRLQRVPISDADLLFPLPPFSPATRGPAAENMPSSPTPSRIPRSTALRRTRSAAPTFGSFSSPSDLLGDATPRLARDGLASPTPVAPAGPTRELRPRPRPAGALVGSGIVPGRRALSASAGSGASTVIPSSSPSAPSTRRRTFGGAATLTAVIEDEPASSPAVAAPAGATTPMTRSRSLSEGEVETAGEGERRLRRRRTVGSGVQPATPSGRRGLR
ncbi:hypothetical protein JCM3770_001655 [Rhodotorula araucariae]